MTIGSLCEVIWAASSGRVTESSATTCARSTSPVMFRVTCRIRLLMCSSSRSSTAEGRARSGSGSFAGSRATMTRGPRTSMMRTTWRLCVRTSRRIRSCGRASTCTGSPSRPASSARRRHQRKERRLHPRPRAARTRRTRRRPKTTPTASSLATSTTPPRRWSSGSSRPCWATRSRHPRPSSPSLTPTSSTGTRPGASGLRTPSGTPRGASGGWTRGRRPAAWTTATPSRRRPLRSSSSGRRTCSTSTTGWRCWTPEPRRLTPTSAACGTSSASSWARRAAASARATACWATTPAGSSWASARGCP
mmetsp:Transcript_74181/g.231133  ORF Transcript_74181/g.231133 Transcript_74181/m.231133 type:complete len:306 (+) Transcript_74181:1160-2077(+)